MSEVLLIIDPQEDFAEPENGIGGALAVGGGRAALANVANFINNYGRKLDDIIVTLDCHNPLHIAHTLWFQDEDGNEPQPFKTVVEEAGEMLIGSLDAAGQFTAEGKVRCRKIGFTAWTLSYLRALKDSGRYPHMLWPEHCLIGSPGHAIVPPVRDAIQSWERREFAVAPKITKGSNLKTEHFGALRAEVPDPKDPSTQVNSYFLQLLSDPDATIYGSGLALSHCLSNTARDTAEEFDGDAFCKRFVLLEDGTASVGGLEFLGEKFVSDFQARGMRVARTTDF